MRKQIMGGLFIAALGTSAGTLALDNIEVSGSGGIAVLTRSVLAACPSAIGLSFRGYEANRGIPSWSK